MKRFFTLMLISAVALFSSCDEEQSIDEVEVLTISNVTLSSTSLGFSMGDESQALTVTTTPEEAVVKSIVWSVKDADPAGCITVDEDGVVTPVSVGTATIVVTATSEDGLTVSAECQVSVLGVDASSLSISKDSLYFNSGDYEILTASVYPDYAMETDVIWTLEDISAEGCVTLIQLGNSNAKVTGVNNGTAIAVATLASNDEIFAKCLVTVVVDAAAVVVSDETLVFEIGTSEDTYQLTANVYPETTLDTDIVWSIKDVTPEGCLTIDDNGLVTMDGENVATATVVVSLASDSSIYTECKVYVYFAVLDVSLSEHTLDFYYSNAGSPLPELLEATVSPDEALQDVTWEVVDASPIDCVTVEDGLVTANTIGVATVVAYSDNNPEMRDYCTVTVHEILTESIELTNSGTVYGTSDDAGSTDLYINISNDELLLAATVYPETATYNTVNWSTENTSTDKITLSSAGLVSITDSSVEEDAGSLTVVASSKSTNSDIAAKCTFNLRWIYPASIDMDDTHDGYVGRGDKLTATIISELESNEVSDPSLEWSIVATPEGCATVDQSGNLEYFEEGTAVVTVTALDNGVKATCDITVLPVEVESLSLAYTSTIKLNENPTFAVTSSPADATYQDVKWELVSGGDVLTITEEGVVTASQAGTATVKATNSNYDSGDVSESFEITVENYVMNDYYPGDTNPYGIVFAVSNGGVNGKVMWIYEEEGVTAASGYKWATESVLMYADDSTNGRVNTRTVYTYGLSSFTNFPIFNYIHETLNGGVATYADDEVGKWYLPAICEIREWYASMYGWTVVYEEEEASDEDKLIYWPYSKTTNWTSTAGATTTYAPTGNELTDYNAKIAAVGGTEFLWTKYMSGSTEYSATNIRNVYLGACGLNGIAKTNTNFYWRPIMAF